MTLDDRGITVNAILIHRKGRDRADVITRLEIADALGWRDGPVTGRCNSLVAKGWLEESGTKVNKSGKTATLLRLPVIGQRGLFA